MLRKHSLFNMLSLAFVVGAALPACKGDDTNEETEGTEDDDDHDDSDHSTSDGSTSSGTAGTSSDTGSATETGEETGTGTGGGAANGEACADPAECASGNCYITAFGGICSECDADEDCPDGGCTSANPIAGTPATCSDGSLGGGCMSDAACMDGLVCAVIIDVAGSTTSACSECTADGDCSGGQLCAYDLDVPTFTGSRVCVDPGSVTQDGDCDIAGSGDDQCASGFCNSLDVMGAVTLGVCGECEVDADCDAGQVCIPPSFSLTEGPFGATCEDGGTETGTDTGTETGTDSATETGTDTDVGTDTGADTGTGTGTDGSTG